MIHVTDGSGNNTRAEKSSVDITIGMDQDMLHLTIQTLPHTKKGQTEPHYPTILGRWRCNYCGVTSTQCRRRGPPGYDRLCNKCGARWARGTILPQYPKKLYPAANDGNGRRHLSEVPLSELPRVSRVLTTAFVALVSSCGIVY